MKNKRIALVLTSILALCSLSSCFLLRINISGNYHYQSSTVGRLDVDTEYKTPTYTSAYSKDRLNVDYIGLGMGYRYLPSTGDRKILVVPVATKDYSFNSSDISKLNDAFFGEDYDTGWESVASFYEKSSYGKLHITGEVTSTVTLNMTKSQLENANYRYGSNGNYTDTVLNSVLATLEENYDLAQYDTDDDGYIDAVWMVYSPNYESDSDLFWAYTTWKDDTKSFDGKKACLYSWASIDFLSEMSYVGNRADSHTYIHETGHMLGLDDYYSYDYSASLSNMSGNADTPLGGVDMMDFNIGDHCAFSKYLLGWSEPTVVDQEFLKQYPDGYSLKSATESGQSLLIPVYKDGEVEYNNTAFDEYLLVEYYTPTELNYQDSRTKYANGLAEYSVNGVLVYHVNATIGKLISQSGSIVWDGYAYDKLPQMDSKWGYEYLYTYIYSNTRSYCFDTTLSDGGLNFYRGRLISLLPATGKKIEGIKTGYSTNTSLFKKGSSFTSSLYLTFKFDDGGMPLTGFSVENTSSSYCNINFEDF